VCTRVARRRFSTATKYDLVRAPYGSHDKAKPVELEAKRV